MRERNRYTRELLAPIVTESYSVAEVLRRLGVRPAGGMHHHIARRIKEFELDTSHFLGQSRNRGQDHKGGPSRRTPEELLVQGDPNRIPRAVYLRWAMLASGVAYRCVLCELGPEWQERPLVLQIDHINGERHDNRLVNLRFLCPNCHSQTETFGIKKRARGGTVDAAGLGPAA